MNKIRKRILSVLLIFTMILSCFGVMGEGQKVQAATDNVLTFKGIHYGNGTNIMIDTNLPDSANCSNFLATENGNNLIQSGAQAAGWFNMGNFSAVSGKKIVTVVFNNSFTSGQSYTLGVGSKFVLGDGTYVLDGTYTFTYNGNDSWSMDVVKPDKTLSFQGVHYGLANQFMIKTNLTDAANCSNFLATDNRNEIIQSGSQQVGYFAMHNFSVVSGTKIITPTFNSDFAAGDTYTLEKGSKFVLGDGTYILDETYTFTYHGSESWSMQVVIPEKALTFNGVHYGTASQILIDTNLTDAANCENFLATDNGNDIKQSGIQQVGYFAMHNFSAVEGKKIITPTFNSNFSEGDTYVLEDGSKFVLGDGTYVLDGTYTFTYTGSGWTMDVRRTLSFNGVHYGTASQIMIETNLTDAANCGNFLATDNGNDIKQSGNQQVGYFAMHNFSEVEGKKIITPVFNADFSAGQTYTLNQGSKFVLGNGSYILDKNYTFTYNGGESWTMMSAESDTVIVDGEEKEVVGRVTLTPGYTAATLIQFTNVYDFGFSADNSEIGFSGEVFLDGTKQDMVQVLGYTSPATTICLNNIAHEGKILTIKKDSVLYVGDKAVVVDQEFCGIWENNAWTILDSSKEYIKVDGAMKEVVGRVTLTPGYTASTLVQFTNVHDFGFSSDNSAIQFSGEVFLDDVKQSGVEVVGYTSPTATICFNNIAHEGKVLKIAANSVLYVEDKAVIITDTFEQVWKNGAWKAPADGTFEFTKIHSGANSYLQVLSDLPLGSAGTSFNKDSEGYDWMMGTTTFTSGSYYDIDGQLLFSFNLDSNSITEGTTIELKKGTIVAIQEGRYELNRDYTFTYSGGSWSMEKGKIETPDSVVVADVNGDGKSNSCDLVRLVRVLEGEYSANNQADMNMDGKVNREDVAYLRYLILNPTDDLTDAQLATFNFTGGKDFTTFADLPDDWADASNIADYKALGMNTALVTNDYHTLNYSHSTITGTVQSGYANPFNMGEGAHYVPGNLVQFKTSLPSSITEGLYSLDTTNQIGTLQSETISIAVSGGVVYAAFSFGRYPNSGEKFILKAGTTFAAGGVTYTLDRDYEVTLTNGYLQSIENVDKAGLDVWVRNHDNTATYFDNKWDILAAKKDVIDGFYLFDEVKQSEFEAMGTTAANISSRFPNAYLHANHVPISSYNYYNASAASAEAYSTFLNNYVSSVAAKATTASGVSLGFDNYPFFITQGRHLTEDKIIDSLDVYKDFPGIGVDYLLNLQTAAEVAKANKSNGYLTDYSICIQTFKAYDTVSHESNNGRDIAKKEEVTFQLYAGMAFGANMFEYFAYKSLSSGSIYNAILDDGGNVRTELYNMVKAANDETLCFADMINTFTWQGTNTISGTTEGEGFEKKWNQPAFESISSMVLSDSENGVLKSYAAEHDAVIGCFTKGQRDGYMVVNYNDPSVVTGNNTISLTFENCTRARIYVSNGSQLTTQIVELQDGTYTREVAPGSAFFIIPA